MGLHPAVAAQPTKGTRRGEEDVAAGPVMGRPESQGVRAITKARSVKPHGPQKRGVGVYDANVSIFDWVRAAEGGPPEADQRGMIKNNRQGGMYVCFFVCIGGVYRHCDGDW